MTPLHAFEAYLVDRQLVQKKQLPYFIRWAANYLSFCEKFGLVPLEEFRKQFWGHNT
jgi:hypothetical protein